MERDFDRKKPFFTEYLESYVNIIVHMFSLDIKISKHFLKNENWNCTESSEAAYTKKTKQQA